MQRPTWRALVVPLAVAQHLPFVPVINRDAFWVHRKNVHGWQPDQWNLYPYYNDVWLG